MPDLAEQDDRWAVRAPAWRARVVPAPLDALRDTTETRPARSRRALLNVLVVTGPSGVGKGTLIRRLLERKPGFALSISATTRSPRRGEVAGRDYHFLTPEEFERRVARGDFLEHAHYSGNRYGTLRSELERDAGGLLLEIELEGARQVREALPEAVEVFIAPPSADALRERLEARGTDAPEQIERRLARAREELAARPEFEHVIVNDDLHEAVDRLVALAATIEERQPPHDQGVPE
ncbi:MAG: guanylate kinase [Thermoleophilaceae bacterium]